MAKLSVVIITYNEEHNIERCLESVKEIASEIVVVDSHSQDRTVALCRQQGARVILHPFENFGKQKQFAQSQATHEWILSLDADEQLSPALQKSIKEALEEPRAEAFSMNRLTNFCGQWIRHGGWYPDRKVRLYRKECARWSNHPVHEQLEVQEGAMTAHLKGDLLHYSIYDLDHHIRQINRYSTIAAEEMVGQRRSINGVHLRIKPLIRFIKIFVIRKGFLDGYFGYVIARNSAFALYLRYAKAKALQKANRP
ncbi:MAG: glycosyl transferase [Bacteroidetes bacterium]|nr:MAG: glycosyl transferase [Bacteroidota bacterium]